MTEQFLPFPGQAVSIPETESIRVQVSWCTPVDLDLHLWAVRSEGMIGESHMGHVCYSARRLVQTAKGPGVGSLLVDLDQDAGIGGRVATNGNQETMTIHSMGDMETMLVGLHNFSRGQNPMVYAPRIRLTIGARQIVFPFDGSTMHGFSPPHPEDRLAGLFLVTRYGGFLRIVRLNRSFSGQPQYAQEVRRLAYPVELSGIE